MNEKSTDYMKWIIKKHSEPNKELIHQPNIQDSVGNTAMMLWIQYISSETGELPPKYLFHDLSLKNDDGETCTMFWIKFVNTNEHTFPIELIYDDGLAGKDGSCLILWIKHVLKKTNSSFPEWIIISECEQDCFGNTAAMCWICEIGTNPPEEIQHAPDIKDVNGNECLDLWIEYVDEEPPEWMTEYDREYVENSNGSIIYQDEISSEGIEWNDSEEYVE